MAVSKLENGRWNARISYRDESGRVKTHQKRFDTKREALNYETDYRRGLIVDTDTSSTFDQIFEEYLKLNSQKANESTINEKIRIKKNFFDNLGSMRMNKITKKIYSDTWINISNTDYSIAYRNKAIAQLKSIANYAYLYFNIENNAKLLEPIRRTSVDITKMKVWTEQEFKLFNSYVKSDTLAALFHLMYYTGLRRGEALALQKDDLVGNKISVNKSIKHFDNGFLPLKTLSSVREVELDSNTVKIIQALTDYEGPFLFGGDRSISISTLQRTFTEAKKLSSVPNIRLHDLRHSHASLLLNRGANIVAVSKRLGHSDVSITLKVYTHLMDESQQELIEILEKDIQKDIQ